MSQDSLYLVTGRIPAWGHYHPEGAHQSGYGWADSRDLAIALANQAIAGGWKDVTIWEPPAAPKQEEVDARAIPSD